MMRTTTVAARPIKVASIVLALVGGLIWTALSVEGAPPKKTPPPGKRLPQPPSKPVAPPAPPSALLTIESWQNASRDSIQSGEIDKLIASELQNAKIEPAQLTTDEQFIRRVTLDLTGQLPSPAAAEAFVADRSPDKRAKLINRLLESDAYARHWARYWREVISARLPNPPGRGLAQGFEEWMFDQVKHNRSWGEIAKAIITAEGQVKFAESEKNGAAVFLAAHRGADAANERAAETSRVFLGIQIQCAQCHDHPSDQWKRVQFHELAGYFARLRERPVRDGKMVVGIELFSAPRGEHEMPSKEDPKKGLVTYPRFLNGHSPGMNVGDHERRQALAKEIIDKNNYWFAGAYVNRIWGVLMGQSFYQPVDDMGPQKEAVFSSVLTRLTGAFRGSNYDMKTLFRDVMNTQTYQRQIRPSEANEHLHFAAAYPTRLPADALWQALVGALGPIGPRPPIDKQRAAGPKNLGPQGIEAFFKLAFEVDPSLKADEVEGSISQALLMMNNPAIQGRIKARPGTLLGDILKESTDDDQALEKLYRRTLARKPTDRERDKCRQHIKAADNRAEAFEDILWALINSTEFQTKR